MRDFSSDVEAVRGVLAVWRTKSRSHGRGRLIAGLMGPHGYVVVLGCSDVEEGLVFKRVV